ncbi:MAG TPA: hypothetical protein VFK85_04175 [Anaeromyxobacteraceae bacterium]|nr:hypothetical protein [Anaeromyxobacteraceae bacterium]
MSRPAVLTFLLVVAAAACGGGSGGSAPSGPPPSPQPSPSPTATPSPAPQPTATPTPSPQPTSTPSPETGQVAIEIERVDFAGECDGLVPDRAPAAVTLTTSAPTGAVCLGGTGDGTGHVALGVREAGVVTWTVFRPDGSRAGSASGAGLDALVRQAEGWHGVVSTPLYSPFQASELVRIGTDGAIGVRTPLTPPDGFLVTRASMASDPAGGSAVAASATAIGGNHPSTVEVFRFDVAAASAHAGRRVMSDTSPIVSFLGVGVSRMGEEIVTYRTPGMLAWTWVGRDGTTLATGGVAQVDVAATDPVELEPLLDGSVAARFDGAWSAVIPHLGVSASPAPQWLAAARGTTLRFTRGNRGYAVLPRAGEQLPACAQVVELRAPSGTLCGRITVREGAGACTGGAIEQGWDGTLIHQSTRDGCTATGCTCSLHAWPRLLAGP